MWAWAAIILVAVFLRFYALGQPLITSGEAARVLPALQLSTNVSAGTFANTFYTLFTALTFYLTEATEFTARILPAIFGLILVTAPLWFRKYLPGWALTVLGLMLALDPASISASRTAGSHTFAIVAVLVILAGLLHQNKLILLLGIISVFLSGPFSWVVLVVAGIALFGAKLLVQRNGEKENVSFDLRLILLLLVIAGTIFFIFPAGLGSIGTGLTDVFTKNASVRVDLLPIAILLIVSQPVGLFFGFIEILCSKLQGAVAMFLGSWAILAFIAIALYPNRSMQDLVLITIPLLGLTSIFLTRVAKEARWKTWQTWSLAGVVLAFLVFVWLRIVSFNNPATKQLPPLTIAASIILPIVLIAGITLIVSWWTDRHVALQGLLLGLLLASAIWFSSQSWHATGLPADGSSYIWREGAVFEQQSAFQETLQQISTWKTREDRSIDVTVLSLDNPIVRWVLRDMENVSYVTTLSPEARTHIILTQDGGTTGEDQTYRGQSFIYSQSYGINSLTPSQWFTWLTRRELPKQQTNLVLWARSELFTDWVQKP